MSTVCLLQSDASSFESYMRSTSCVYLEYTKLTSLDVALHNHHQNQTPYLLDRLRRTKIWLDYALAEYCKIGEPMFCFAFAVAHKIFGSFNVLFHILKIDRKCCSFPALQFILALCQRILKILVDQTESTTIFLETRLLCASAQFALRIRRRH